MHLNIRALQALRALISEGTVSAAAHRLHRSQPAVSRLLAQLEADVGFPLFRHEGRRLLPTQEALAFHLETERAFTALAEIEATANDIRDRQGIPLRILAQSHVVHGLLHLVLGPFCERHAAFRFSIEVRSREYISHWIANRQFDVGFAPRPVDHPQVESRPLVRAPLYVLMPATHRLAGRRRVRIQDLEGEPIITTHAGAPIRARLDALFSANEARPLIRGETATALSACQLVAEGAGITVCDPFLARLYMADRAVRFRPLAPRADVEYLELRPSGSTSRSMATEFVAAVRKTAEQVVREVAKRAREPR